MEKTKLNQTPQNGKQNTELFSEMPHAAQQLLIVTADRATSARELHAFLEIATPFTMWFDRMKEYGFTEGVDYVEVSNKNVKNPQGGRPSTDYALTLDTAKEISMIQRREKGKQARQYFIACEKQLREGDAKPLSKVYLKHSDFEKLDPYLPFTQIEVEGKPLMGIEHPKYGYLFTVQQAAIFLDSTETSVRSRKKHYPNLILEGTHYRILLTESTQNHIRTLFFTTEGLYRMKDTLFHLHSKRFDNKPKALPKPTPVGDNTLDLLIQIDDKTLRTGLFENLKTRGII